MLCKTCGMEVPEGQAFCSGCGTAVETAVPKLLTMKEYLKLPENKKLKSNITSSAVICYICSALTLIVSILGNPFGILDVAIVLACGILIQTIYSRAAAIVVLVYSIISTVIALIATGRLGGWLLVLAGIYAVIYTFKLRTEYNNYKNNKVTW